VKPPSLNRIDLAGCALIAAGALGMYFLGIAPAQRARAQETADRAELDARRKDLEESQRQLSDAKKKLADLETRVDQNARVLHPGSELYARLQAITAKAQEKGLKISEMKPSPAVVGKRFNRVPIRLAGVGSYVSFREFVKALHELYPDVQLGGFSLSGKAEDPKIPVSFDAELNWFTSVESVESGSGPAGPAGGADDKKPGE
jgi:Tfp pilus assembly protein PilO